MGLLAHRKGQDMMCFGLAILAVLAVFALRWLVGWMTYVNNRD
jgi:hypothetical protein